MKDPGVAHMIKCSKTLPYYFNRFKDNRMTNVETFERFASDNEIEELKSKGWRVRKIKKFSEDL